MSITDDRKREIMRAARKRDPKSLQQFADEIGVARQGLAAPVAALVTEGRLVRDDAARPPTYTKA